MTDDLDHYTNTYHIYSKDLKNCEEFLGLPEVINWKQHLQIQSNRKGFCTGSHLHLQQLLLEHVSPLPKLHSLSLLSAFLFSCNPTWRGEKTPSKLAQNGLPIENHSILP